MNQTPSDGNSERLESDGVRALHRYWNLPWLRRGGPSIGERVGQSIGTSPHEFFQRGSHRRRRLVGFDVSCPKQRSRVDLPPEPTPWGQQI